MKIHKQKNRKGFTLVELLVVIAIIASLAALSTPAVTKALKRAALTTSVSNARQVKLALDNFAVDFDGEYINDTNGAVIQVGFAAGSSADVYYDVLIDSGALDRSDEGLFYSKEYRTALPALMEGDGVAPLAATECAYGYVKGLANTSPGPAPVVTTKPINAAGTFPSGVWDHRAVIARVNGSVAAERLTGASGTDAIVNENVSGATANVFAWATNAAGVICN